MTIHTQWKTCALLLSLTMLITGCLSSNSSSSNTTPSPDPGQPTAPEIPEVNVQAYLGAGAIGVSDLEASVTLYTEGLGLREIKRLTRSDRTEVVLEAANGRGSRIVLMDFTDNVGRNFQQNPGKLVFYVADPAAYAQDFVLDGGRITVPPAAQPSVGNIVVGFGRDFDNNLIEIVGDPRATQPFLGAFGIGVSDLEAAKDFYVDTFGLEVDQFLQIPGQYDEYILTSPVPGSSAVVLMNWTNGSSRNYTDNPVKLEFEVSDPAAFAARIEAAGLPIVSQPSPSTEPDLKGNIAGYAADADGTLLEIRQSIRSYLGAAGIGVEDLEAATDFYKEGLGMRELSRQTREDRVEVTLQSADGRALPWCSCNGCPPFSAITPTTRSSSRCVPFRPRVMPAR